VLTAGTAHSLFVSPAYRWLAHTLGHKAYQNNLELEEEGWSLFFSSSDSKIGSEEKVPRVIGFKFFILREVVASRAGLAWPQVSN
jgi:hypothetical protein